MLGRISVVMMLAIVATSSAIAGERVPYGACIHNSPDGHNTCLTYMTKEQKRWLGDYGKACTSIGDKWTTNAPCPAQNRIGICKAEVGLPSEMWTVFYANPYEASFEAELARGCKSTKGTWSSK